MSGHLTDINVSHNEIINELTTFTGEEVVNPTVAINVDQFEKYTDTTFSDVMNFLKRPRFIERIGLSSSSSFATVYPLNRLFFDNHFNLSSRFKGCCGVRFKTCFRVVVAATPQMQGLLRMFYDPIPSVGSSPVYSDTFRNSAFSIHPTAYTQLPGVELDFRNATAMDFSVPYTHYLDFMPLAVEADAPVADSFSMGAVNLIDYLRVRFAGTQIPYLTTYCWLEDVEVFGAVNDPVTVVFPQAGSVEDVEKDGPMSGPLYKLSKAASLIGGAIPSLTSMVTPLAWALRTSSNAIASFGYSRPLQLEAVPRAILTTQHYQNNADGPDASFNMGLLQANTVKVIDNIGFTNEDEMSIAFLVSKAANISRVRVSDSTQGRFFTLFLAPTAMYGDIDSTALAAPVNRTPHLWNANVLTGSVIMPSPLMWLGSMFNKYRGGFKVTVKCNATMFHSGRVMLTYTPYARGDIKTSAYTLSSGSVGVVGTDATGINTIWDIREGNTCSIDCPYFSLSPYMRDDQPIGTFSMSVLDNIALVGTAGASVTFAVEVSGLPGFEFQEPHQGPYIVEPGFDHRAYDTSYNTSQIVPQSGSLVPCSNTSEICVGENVKSVKQLLSRAEWTTLSTYKAYRKLFSYDKGVYLRHWFDPPVCTGTFEPSPGVFRFEGTYHMSTHNLILYAYLFARGGTCFDILGDTIGVANYGPYASANKSGQNQVSSQMWCKDGDLKLKAPFYANTKKTYAVPVNQLVGMYKINGGQIREGTGYCAMNRPLMYYGNNPNTMIGKRAADDAQLGFFMYAPPMRYVGNGPISITDYVSPGAIDANVYLSQVS